MTKKNLKPQQAAPVQREINTSSSAEGLTPLQFLQPSGVGSGVGGYLRDPFAGDDAE